MVQNFMVQNDNDRSDLYSKLLEDRIILVYGEVNMEMAMSITSQLLYLDSINHNDIKLFINSPGGSISAGFAILDTMGLVKSDVSTTCLGMSASMGAVLLAAGTKGKRFITKNSEVMIHQPLGGSSGQETEMRLNYERIKKLRDRIEEYLSEWTGQPVKKIHEDCERDNWFNADEAIEYGLVDKKLEY